MIPKCDYKLHGDHDINKIVLEPRVAHLRMTDQWSGTLCEILVEWIIRNNSVKSDWIVVSDSGGDVV